VNETITHVLLTTPRLAIRELTLSDFDAFWQLESNPDVYRYLGYAPVHHKTEAELKLLHHINQYKQYGMGRWALVDKQTNQFVGLCGVRFATETENNRTHFYDLGYRLLPQFWGKGLATEAAQACVAYAFEVLQVPEIISMIHVDHHTSKRVAGKCGLSYEETFSWYKIGYEWFSLTKYDWEQQHQQHEYTTYQFHGAR
jgi:RimJ/RimL family protein N-acetyltransferase